MNIKHFIRLGFAEGMSALVLFLIAMPLKYMFDMPLAVKYVGTLHGFLFVLYCVAIAIYGFSKKWKFTTMVLLVISAIIPAGPLFMEKRILKREMELK